MRRAGQPPARGLGVVLTVLVLVTPASAAVVAQQESEPTSEPRVVDVPMRTRSWSPHVLDVRPKVDGRVRTVPSDVLFSFGSDVLSPDAKRVLLTVAQELTRTRGRIVVTGHTDSVGDERSNLRLSERRAGAVARLLHTAAPRLTFDIRGKGETQPVTPDTRAGRDDPDARRRNRRVTIALPP